MRTSIGAGFIYPVLRRHAHDAGSRLGSRRRADIDADATIVDLF